MTKKEIIATMSAIIYAGANVSVDDAIKTATELYKKSQLVVLNQGKTEVPTK